VGTQESEPPNKCRELLCVKLSGWGEGEGCRGKRPGWAEVPAAWPSG
jgi:hypothetical protein